MPTPTDTYHIPALAILAISGLTNHQRIVTQPPAAPQGNPQTIPTPRLNSRREPLLEISADTSFAKILLATPFQLCFGMDRADAEALHALKHRVRHPMLVIMCAVGSQHTCSVDNFPDFTRQWACQLHALAYILLSIFPMQIPDAGISHRTSFMVVDSVVLQPR